VDDRLIAIVCTDRPEKKVFELLYLFDKEGKVKEKKVKVKREKAVVKSVCDKYKSAEVFEREIHDFYGVEFEGNPTGEERLFVSDDMIGKYPLRKKGGKRNA
jgi:NADH:ubiquinone oxidoreductase subunit C